MFLLKCAQNIPRKICKKLLTLVAGWEGNGVVKRRGWGQRQSHVLEAPKCIQSGGAREAFKEKIMQDREYRIRCRPSEGAYANEGP